MIARRDVLGGALALALPVPALGAALPVPPSGRLGFDVWRGSRQLGTHDLVFHPSADGLVVDVSVDIAFRIGPITLYHYTHHAHERWAGGDVVEISTQTNDNGTRYRIEGHRDSRGLVIEPGGAVGLAAALNGRLHLNGGCGVVVASGGNVDPAVFQQALARL